ncbi:30S ribosomal protein S1 [Buchnera aphidicola]|uniref:30S ribosomal protein S1 n=1 Tax=Buchnera aphidicola TaxID=9 RepID=UPI003463E4CE
MNESFSKLFEESLNEVKTQPGSIISGIVISIEKDTVLVDAGLKSESYISIEQFKNHQGKLEIQVGDSVDVALDAIEDGFGSTLLSREKAKKHEAWIQLENAYKNTDTILGVISGKVKGGFTVELNDLRAFLPGSLVDIRPLRDTSHLEGKELEFKVIKLDQKRNNVVVSRKAVIEFETSAERDQLLLNLKEGMKISGIVKNLTDYGAFIDLGGVDGLLHITDMAWKRVKHPNEIVNIGDEINVKILKFDRDRNRVSLGLKQLSADPWISISTRHPEGAIVSGRVTNLTDYGCFVEIQEGVEGLVHVSEMDWTNKNIHPSKMVSVSDIVQVTVLDIDEDRRRISLGLKQCKPNPWKIFSKTHKKGVHVKGKIKSITDFGIFIGLTGGIDGLVHLSDIKWNASGEEYLVEYKKGQEISAVVLQVDPDRERISLGIKQLQEDPLYTYITAHKKEDLVIGKIVNINNSIATVKLSYDVLGILNIHDISTSKNSRFKDITNILMVEDIIQCKIKNFDRKNRIINLFFYHVHIINNTEYENYLNKIKSNFLFSEIIFKKFQINENLK